MKDARGLDVTTDDATTVAAADDFAARLLRLDQGVEAILDAAKRWPNPCAAPGSAKIGYRPCREPGSGLRLRLEAAGFRPRPRLAGRRHRRAARRGGLDHGFARRPLAGEQIFDLVAGQRLEFEQPLGQRFEISALLLENALRLGVAGLDQTLDLGVDLAARLLRDILLARHLVAQEHLVLVLAIGDR